MSQFDPICLCGNFANHWSSTLTCGYWRGYCCKCWVEAGNPPSSWHYGCLAAISPERKEAIEQQEAGLRKLHRLG